MTEISKQSTLSRTGDQILRFPDRARVTHKNLLHSKRIVILIHGFTADAGYLEQLMQDLEDDEVSILVFEYACYRGIDVAAESLRYRLSLLDRDGKLSSSRITLVGHSMGGLVARFLVCLLGGDKYVHTVITLGTPHQGTLQNSAILPLLIDWSHSVASAAPIAFTPKSQSAKQLIGQDEPPTLLDRLKNAPPPSLVVRFYSISGGYPNIEFGRGFLKNAVARHWLRNNLSIPNDGLVEEFSSDITSDQLRSCFSFARHFKEYPEYPDINHSNLVNNQGIALEISDIIARNGEPAISKTAGGGESIQPRSKDAH